jgi:hypothetical protein
MKSVATAPLPEFRKAVSHMDYINVMIQKRINGVARSIEYRFKQKELMLMNELKMFMKKEVDMMNEIKMWKQRYLDIKLLVWNIDPGLEVGGDSGITGSRNDSKTSYPNLGIPNDDKSSPGNLMNPVQTSKLKIVNPDSACFVNPDSVSIIKPGSENTVKPGSESTVKPGSETTVNYGFLSIVNPGPESSINPGSKNTVNFSSESIVNPGTESTINLGTETTVNPGSKNIVNLCSESTVNLSSACKDSVTANGPIYVIQKNSGIPNVISIKQFPLYPKICGSTFNSMLKEVFKFEDSIKPNAQKQKRLRKKIKKKEEKKD